VCEMLDTCVQRSSSPGYPASMLYKNNGQFIDAESLFITDVVVSRMKALSRVHLDSLSSEELVLGRYCDVFKMFVKNEPHKWDKVKDGRLRLIFSCSLVDQIIDRVLCMKQNCAEILSWRDCPSKPGMGSTDEMLDDIAKDVYGMARGRNIHSIDVSGWDWSFTKSLFAADLERRLLLCDGRGDFRLILENRFLCLSRKVLLFSDGSMVAQSVDGIMPSGAYITSSTNSFGSNLKSREAGADDSRAMGDDCLAVGMINIESYSVDGFRLKVEGESPDEFEFCSMSFRKTGYELTNPWKTVYRFFSQKPSHQLREQFCYDMRYFDSLAEVLEYADRVGWDAKELLRNDGEEDKISETESASGVKCCSEVTHSADGSC